MKNEDHNPVILQKKQPSVSRSHSKNGAVDASSDLKGADEATDVYMSNKSIETNFGEEADSSVHHINSREKDNGGDDTSHTDKAVSRFDTFEIDEEQPLLETDKNETLHSSRDNNNTLQLKEECVPPWRTCIALCSGFIFSYSAFEAIQNLQSSLNAEGHLGELSLSVMYASVLIGALLGPVIAKLVSHKGILCLGFLGHIFYTCTNFLPTFATLIPASAVQGVASGGIGMSQGVYIAAISNSYIYFNNLPESKLYGTISFFNGLFYCSFKATQISGNLLSSMIFQTTAYNSSVLTDNKCGAQVCSGFKDAPQFERPSARLIHALFGSFALMNCIGFAIFVFGLPHLKNASEEGEKKTAALKGRIKGNKDGCLSIIIDPKFMAFIPHVIAESILVMVSYSGYTKAFVSCAVGVQWVGYTMVALGVVSSLTALTANYLAQYTGRIAQFTVGMSVDIVTVAIMLLWEPDSRTSPSVLMVVPMMFGFSQGILQPQQQALIGSIFSKEQLPAAYSAANGAKCLGFSIYLCMASTLCLYHGLLLALGIYIPGVLGYIYIEVTQWRREKG
ncbi:Unc-93-like protein A [Elysia marginata]|uniref:Unc-93-like protein A n=1 Tax=Elysia marginata TaxID=1093978 RepID=A0AAV4JE33_9GAST|nr:Unc-93-like protein A [Elysia marginata]